MSTNTWDRELFSKAWEFASIRHAGQTYGGKDVGLRIEYLNHLGSVYMEVMWALGQTEEYCDSDLAVCCAVLHDTLEDTSTTFEELEAIFGQRIANGVLALTKNEKLPTKESQMKDSLDRIRLQPKEISMVKLADRISNLYAPPFYWDKKKIQSYRIEAQLILDALASCNKVLAERLGQRIDDYARFL